MIDAGRVHEITLDSLYKDDEDTTGYVPGPGIVSNLGFHPARLESHREEVKELLLQLPDQFMESKGAGWSFLQAALDRDGNQWTGLHRDMENLFQLGTALGYVKLCLPERMWSALPGGMPYYTVLDKKMR